MNKFFKIKNTPARNNHLSAILQLFSSFLAFGLKTCHLIELWGAIIYK